MFGGAKPGFAADDMSAWHGTDWSSADAGRLDRPRAHATRDGLRPQTEIGSS